MQSPSHALPFAAKIEATSYHPIPSNISSHALPFAAKFNATYYRPNCILENIWADNVFLLQSVPICGALSLSSHPTAFRFASNQAKCAHVYKCSPHLQDVSFSENILTARLLIAQILIA
jgi:hypothetical protein